MRNKLTLPALVVGGVLVFTFALLPISASAVLRPGQETTTEQTTDDPQLLTQTETPKRRLSATNVRRCEQRDQKIKTLMDTVANRAERHTTALGAITKRITDFYEKKNKTVADYDALLAAVDAAKATLASDVAALKDLGNGFSCSGDDPKGDAQAFRAMVRTVQQDIKDYHTAIKRLIVAVRTAQSEGEER